MMPERQHARSLHQYGNAAAALLVSILILGLLGAGLKTIPALGPALVPGHGAWESAAGGQRPAAQTLSLPGLSAPARVSFTQAYAVIHKPYILWNLALAEDKSGHRL